MTHPAFDWFEEICAELSVQDEIVLIDDDFSPPTLDEIKRWSKEPGTTAAISKALVYLRDHFVNRGSVLPFTYETATGRTVANNRDYIQFVASAQEQRYASKAESKNFEVATSQRLAERLTGILRRVGWPRSKYKSRKSFAGILESEFGFEKEVLAPRDKDGGLDILWFPPLGSFPFRAIASIQCKNAPYDRDSGFKSVARAKQTLARHSHASAEECHLHCVIYNDYIDEKMLRNARDAQFVPLGLSDLAPPTAALSFELL